MNLSLTKLLSLVLLAWLTSCSSKVEVQFDPQMLASKWVCTEVYQGDKKQEIFSGAYILELHPDSRYRYKAGMYEDEGNWTINKGEILLTNQIGDQMSLEIIAVSDTSLIVEKEQSGGDLRMHLNNQI